LTKGFYAPEAAAEYKARAEVSQLSQAGPTSIASQARVQSALSSINKDSIKKSDNPTD
jgi:hypothetical protein